jgi:hypothetical protein
MELLEFHWGLLGGSTGTELRAYWEALGVGDALNNTVIIRWSLHLGKQCCTGVLRPALGPLLGQH